MERSKVEAREDEPLIDRSQAPLAAVRHNWVMAVVITLGIGLLGALVGLILPVSYTAETRVAVGQGTLTSSATAGFPLAAMDLASNYARYVNNTGTARQSTHPDAAVSASQIPESNVIRLEATSRDPELAKATATEITDELIAQVNDETRQRELETTRQDLAGASVEFAEAYSHVQSTSAELIRLQAPPVSSATQIENARQRLAESKAIEGRTQAELNAQQTKLVRMISEDSQAAKLTVVREVGDPASSRMSSLQLGLLIGLVLGAGAAVAATTLKERRRQPDEG